MWYAYSNSILLEYKVTYLQSLDLPPTGSQFLAALEESQQVNQLKAHLV